MSDSLAKPPTADRRATAAPGSTPATPARLVQHIRSDELFAGANEVHIEHRGALYRLQRTSLGKLILTK
jgi:hemin uptake protein HemP